MVASEPEYMRKIRTHKRLEFEDIKQFTFDQARELGVEDYVERVKIDYIIISSAAAYSVVGKTVYFHPKTKKIIKKEFFDVKVDKLIALKNMIFCKFNDFYNLFMISIIFHELNHAIQHKRKNEDSFFSLLINSSLKFKYTSEGIYNDFHNNFYVEYNANINSAILTLNFIENNFNGYFSKGVLALLNKYFVTVILDCYGVSDKNTSINQNFSSPIDFFNFFLYHEEYSDHEPWPIETIDKPLIDKLKIFINKIYPDLMKNDISDLFNGYPIPPKVLAKLVLIKNGDIETTNFLEEIKREFEVSKKR